MRTAAAVVPTAARLLAGGAGARRAPTSIDALRPGKIIEVPERYL